MHQIADELNQGHYWTRRGKMFLPMSVYRLVQQQARKVA
jgi:hypothetical protein